MHALKELALPVLRKPLLRGCTGGIRWRRLRSMLTAHMKVPQEIVRMISIL